MKNICILGVGRSGTKLLYTITQKILLDNHIACNYSYEPFLWNRDSFNNEFHQVKHNFQYINSISIDGMYYHQQTPLFIPNNCEQHYPCQQKFIDSFFTAQEKDKRINLIKFIRANGRLKLFEPYFKNTLFIFIFRNPIDCIYSVHDKFSFFGGEFHPDDFNRFSNQINNIYNKQIPSQYDSIFEREILWWFYMNKYFIDNCNLNNINLYSTSFESFLEDPHKSIHHICKWLDINYKDDYLDFVQDKVGDITTYRQISEFDLNILTPYYEKYLDFHEDLNIAKPNNTSFNMIVNKYKITKDKQKQLHPLYGRTALSLSRELLKLKYD